MKLYSMAGTCAVSLAIVLEWIGAPYELIVMLRGDNRAPAYLAINGNGEVPALMLDDGRILTEAAAILPFLAACYPLAKLDLGDDTVARAQLAQTMSYLTSEVHVAFKPHFMPERFLDDPRQFDALQAYAWVTLAPMLAKLNALLVGRSFLIAEHRTVADAYLYLMLRWVDEGPGGIAPYPALAEFRARLESDAGVQRALAAHGMAPVAGAN